MSRFLSVVSVQNARDTLTFLARKTADKSVLLGDSLGLILRKDIISDCDIPGFNRSSVDGYAVCASDTVGAGESIPIMLTLIGRVGMGEEPSEPITPGTCMYIPTGGFLPPGADAVAMIEYCEEMGEEVLISKPMAVGENIVFKGEDFSTTNPALKAGTKISSRDMGVLAACGAQEVIVASPPRVAIISTGNEIIPVHETPKAGQIRDVNTYLCTGFIAECGGTPIVIGTIPDEREALETAIQDAVQKADIVLISGGSSKGERDMCADIIAARGEVLIHGIALSPGKPTIIGKIDGKPIIGLPGHPASAYIVLIALVRDLLYAMTGQIRSPVKLSGTLSSSVPSAKGREDYIRIIQDGDIITPVFGKSGLTNTLVMSDGFLCIPADIEGYEKNTRIFAEPWSSE